MTRTYLELLVELPWSRFDPERIDIAEARRILDEDHHGLEKVKRRVLEYLAVRKLNPDGKSPILCFIGPPGVGKTSLGQSIARATDRKFARLSLGGVHDESEIRGHRRTYIGALPGNVIQAIHKAGTRNPVMMLDELDKLGAGFHGDPSAALLEVLDPEQNATFRDNYLAVPFDLSKVMFIGTANVVDNIPAAVRDRMEIIEMPGYIDDEKLAIAKRYLIKRQLAEAGLTEEQCKITDDVLLSIIRDYTREAGVRNLERRIGAICRHAAMRIAEGDATAVVVTVTDLHAILGPKRFEPEIAMRTSVPGVATGLAWTPAGGDILFVDSTHVSKLGSDVNWIFFEILPRLRSGVLVHIHDVFYPFEYPEPWSLEGRSWNEVYILRAFLEYNNQFKILLFPSYAQIFYEQWFRENMPLVLENRGGCMWLRKV